MQRDLKSFAMQFIGICTIIYQQKPLTYLWLTFLVNTKY